MEITTEAIVSIIGLAVAIPSAALAVWHWRRHRSSTKARATECSCMELEFQFPQNTLHRNSRTTSYTQHLLEMLSLRSGRVSASSVHVDTVEMIWSPRRYWDYEVGGAGLG